jgi:hypothetical protein
MGDGRREQGRAPSTSTRLGKKQRQEKTQSRAGKRKRWNKKKGERARESSLMAGRRNRGGSEEVRSAGKDKKSTGEGEGTHSNNQLLFKSSFNSKKLKKNELGRSRRRGDEGEARARGWMDG